MARGSWRNPGGIQRVAELLDAPEKARLIERELIGHGLRLRWLNDGTDRLNWADLVALCDTALPGSPAALAVHGESAAWDTDTHLLAVLVDLANLISGQLSGKPPLEQPVPRPGDTSEGGTTEDVSTVDGYSLPELDDSGVIQGSVLTLDEYAEYLGWDADELGGTTIM